MHTLDQLKARLAQAKVKREQASRFASEAQDDSYAAETEGRRLALVSQSRGYREQAGRLSAEILDLHTRIAAAKLTGSNLESQLKSVPVQVATVVFKTGEVEGQDDTMNFRVEAL